MIVSIWHSMWILLIKAVCNICILSLLQDISGSTFTAMSLEEILCQAVEQLGYYSTEEGLVYTRKGLYQGSFQFWTTLDPTVEPICSPSTAKHFLVEVKQRTAHLSVHWFSLTMPWGTRLATLSMLTISCFGIIFVRWCNVGMQLNFC